MPREPIEQIVLRLLNRRSLLLYSQPFSALDADRKRRIAVLLSLQIGCSIQMDGRIEV
jgi:hypothetical protein